MSQVGEIVAILYESARWVPVVCPGTLPTHPPPPNGSVWVMFSASDRICPSGESAASEVRIDPLLSKSLLGDVAVTWPIMLLCSADSGVGTFSGRGV